MLFALCSSGICHCSRHLRRLPPCSAPSCTTTAHASSIQTISTGEAEETMMTVVFELIEWDVVVISNYCCCRRHRRRPHWWMLALCHVQKNSSLEHRMVACHQGVACNCWLLILSMVSPIILNRSCHQITSASYMEESWIRRRSGCRWLKTYCSCHSYREYTVHSIHRSH